MVLGSLAWDNLPGHILVQIFSNLTLKERYNVSLCCRIWYEWFSSPYLWNDVTIKCISTCGPKWSEGVEKYGHYFKILTIVLDQEVDKYRQQALMVIKTLSKKKSINLSTLKINFVGTNPLFYGGMEFVNCLKELFKNRKERSTHNSALLNVNLSGLSVSFDDEMLDILAQNNSQLTRLNIQNKNLICKISEECILNLIKKCKHLEELALFHYSMSNSVLNALCDEDRVPLKHLSIMCRREDKYGSDLSGESWTEVKRCLPNLRVTLSFNHTCPYYKFADIMQPDIPVLDLRLETFTMVHDELGLAAEYYHDTLEKLSIYTRTSEAFNQALVRVASSCHRLKEMYVYCILKPETIKTILDLHPVMKNRGSYVLSDIPDHEAICIVGIEDGD